MVDKQRIETLEDDNHIKRDQMLKMMKKRCEDIKKKCEKFIHDAKVCETLEWLLKYLMSNPALLVACIVVAATLFIPLFLFILFAIITIVLTFTGFIIVEGAVLTFGTITLCCVLFSIITMIVITGLCFVLAYYIFDYVRIIIRNIKLLRS